MKPADFLDFTPREFFNKLAGFTSLEKSRQKEEWERTRLTWMYIVNYSGNVKKWQNPSDIYRFPWDGASKPKADIMTRERFEALKKRYN